jgi:hypothetical protein
VIIFQTEIPLLLSIKIFKQIKFIIIAKNFKTKALIYENLPRYFSPFIGSSLNKTFDEVRIYDLQGTLKKYQSFSKSASPSINTSALTPGNYLVEIINGAYKEKHQLIIQ